MNRFQISIVRSEREDSTPFNEIRLFVDGRNLIDMLKDFETPLAKREKSIEIAGAYSGLPTAHTRKERFLGLRDRDYGDAKDKVAVLDCFCGCEGCWPIAVKITVSESTVVWSDFEQPHRGADSVHEPWDYSGFGPFEFERNQYEEELGKLDRFVPQSDARDKR